MFIIEYLASIDLALKTIVLGKQFNHPLLKDILPPYLQDLQKVKTNQNLIDIFRSNLISHLVGAKFSKSPWQKTLFIPWPPPNLLEVIERWQRC